MTLYFVCFFGGGIKVKEETCAHEEDEAGVTDRHAAAPLACTLHTKKKKKKKTAAEKNSHENTGRALWI